MNFSTLSREELEAELRRCNTIMGEDGEKLAAVTAELKEAKSYLDSDHVIQCNRELRAERDRLREALEKPRLKLTLKSCGDCWLHIDAPSGNKASINLGQRGSMNDDTLVGRVIREVAELSEATRKEG